MCAKRFSTQQQMDVKSRDVKSRFHCNQRLNQILRHKCITKLDSTTVVSYNHRSVQTVNFYQGFVWTRSTNDKQFIFFSQPASLNRHRPFTMKQYYDFCQYLSNIYLPLIEIKKRKSTLSILFVFLFDLLVLCLTKYQASNRIRTSSNIYSSDILLKNLICVQDFISSIFFM